VFHQWKQRLIVARVVRDETCRISLDSDDVPVRLMMESFSEWEWSVTPCISLSHALYDDDDDFLWTTLYITGASSLDKTSRGSGCIWTAAHHGRYPCRPTLISQHAIKLSICACDDDWAAHWMNTNVRQGMRILGILRRWLKIFAASFKRPLLSVDVSI